MTSTALTTATTQPGMIAPQGLWQGPAPLGATGASGAISGGLIRPGSIDQTSFLQMLQQQQQNRQGAGVGGKPVSMPIQSFQPGIPTLTSAQFAALVGAQEPGTQGLGTDLAAAPVEAPAGDSQAIAAAQQAQARLAAAATPPALRLSGSRSTPSSQNGPSAGNAAKPGSDAGAQQAAVDSAAPEAEAPTITRRGEPTLVAAAGDAPTASAESSAEKQADGETASQGDPNLVHLKSPPDKDEQKELRMRNKRWVVDETPGARELFFGADGKFGWDDFLDLINPLQHIPIVAQIYRAVTGDEINGAANLLGAIPFGPLGGPGMIAAIADLAVKDVTGKDVGGNLEAMVFGDGDKAKGAAGAVPADMADRGAASGNSNGTVQTADSMSRYALSESSQLHEACRG